MTRNEINGLKKFLEHEMAIHPNDMTVERHVIYGLVQDVESCYTWSRMVSELISSAILELETFGTEKFVKRLLEIQTILQQGAVDNEYLGTRCPK